MSVSRQDSEVRTASDQASRGSGLTGDGPPVPVPDHTLLRRIGRGSYGEVWLARNALGTLRAVKIVLRGNFSHDRPFEREFAGIQRFEPISRSHETQLNILHVGRVPDAFYYVMELADSVPAPQAAERVAPESLGSTCSEIDSYEPHTLRSELVRRGRLPLPECLGLALALTAALEHLHQHGLVHRDIKPSNIVYVRGQPKLADIGLVTGVHEAKSFVGTEGYIPPEGPGTLRADIYSLGKVLYELATGNDRQSFPQLPEGFRGTAEGEAFADFNEILLRACASDPANRYETAAHMRAELLLLQLGRSIRGLRADERWVRRLKSLAVIGLSCLVVVAGFALYERQRSNERAIQLRALGEKEEQRRQTAYAADLAIAFQSWEAGRAELARELVEAQRPHAEADLRGWEWRYLWQQTRPKESSRMTTSSPFGFWSCAFSRDGRFVAAGTVDGQVLCWDVGETKPRQILGRPGRINPVDSLAFSPDGTVLYQSLRTDGVVVAWDWATGKERFRFGTGKTGERLSLSADGTLAATSNGPDYAPDGPGELVLWDALTGRKLARAPTQSTWLIRTTFSPDGKHLASAGGRGHAKIWSVPDLQEVAALPHDDQSSLFGVAFSPDGRWLAFGANDGLVRVWDWESGRLRAVWMAHAFGCDAVQWSPDGRLLATGGRDQLIRIWNPADPTELAVLKGHNGRVSGLAFSTDSQALASASEDKSLRLWAISKLVQPIPVRRGRGFLFDPGVCLSPDSRWLALGAEGEKVEVISVPGLEVMTAVDGHNPAVSSDSRWLATVVSNRLEVFGMPSGKLERIYDSKGPLSGGVSFAPDGEKLAMRTAEGSLFVWRRTNSAPLLKVPGTNALAGLFFAAGGRELVAIRTADGALEWIDAETGRRGRRLATGSGSVTCAALSPDGGAVLIGETAARIRLVNLRTGLVELLPADAGSVMSVGWSPDGQTIAAGTFEGFIKLWNTRTRREMAALKGHSSIITAVEFSRDGRLLVSQSYDKSWRVWTAPLLEETGNHPAARAAAIR